MAQAEPSRSNQRRSPSPGGSSPIAEMMDRLRADRYVATKRETEVLRACTNRLRRYGIQGFLASGSIVWSVTGGLNILHRLITTAAGAAAGGFFVTQQAVKPCMEDIISLDGSRLQKEIVTILQESQAHNTKVRELLKKYYYLEPLYDDNAQGLPGVTLRKRELFGVGGEMKEEVHMEDEEVGERNRLPAVEAPSQIPNIEEHEAGTGQVLQHEPEPFVDPFEMLAWSDATDGTGSSSALKQDVPQKRRHRLNVNERRMYNRRRFLEWEEKRSMGDYSSF